MAEQLEEFVTNALRSGLLDRAQLDEAMRWQDVDSLTPQDLAHHLVKLGKLSAFQAKKILKGATLGLKLGPYHIQTPIGKGGMGTIYLALDTRTNRHVAIKVLPPSRAKAGDRYLARFQREMAMSQRVSHPHLAQTHEAGVSQGIYYIVLEYIPGQSLQRLVDTRGPLSVAKAARVFAEAASALEHAHGVGLIHRDLKPSNIMVTPNGHAKVLDLGLALMQGESDSRDVVGGKGYVVGSVNYMAPEQTEDSTQVDPRSDIYALGCSLYFALTGRPPFAEGSNRDKIHAHRHVEPEAVQRQNAQVPDEFAVIVHKMLAKNPEERYASAAEARKALVPWRSPEADKPIEQEGDTTHQAAVAALESAPGLSDSLMDTSVFAESKLDLHGLWDVESRREVRWLMLALAGFWMFMLGAMVIVVLMR